MEGYIAEIRMFAATFAPRNWAYCQGQILSISQNSALFSLLGTTYGGNGQTTFGLPNFASRVAIGAGQGPGLSFYPLGQMAGVESVTLNILEIPQHTHVATGTVSPRASATQLDESNPSGQYMGPSTSALYSPTSGGNMGASPATVQIQPAGGNAPHSNFQPYLGMNYIICLYGIYPSRN